MQAGHSVDVQTPHDVETFDLSTAQGDTSSAPQDGLVSQIGLENSALPNLEASPAENSAPRGKKRKLAESTLLKRARQNSPPWRRAEADGPTSFIEGGRRKSGRTNSIPVDLQPPSAKRQARGTFPPKAVKQAGKTTDSTPRHKSKLSNTAPAAEKASGANGDITKGLATVPASRRRRRVVPRLQDEVYTVETAHDGASPLSTNVYGHPARATKSSSLRHKRARSPKAIAKTQIPVINYPPAASSTTMDNVNQTRRLRLNFRPPPMPLLHPNNVPPPRRYDTFQSWLEADNSFEGEEEHRLTAQEARREATILNRLEVAAKRGGVLNKGLWQQGELQAQEEPPLGYVHLDYLLRHAVDLQPRLERERKEHAAIAKRLAYMALAEYKRRQPKSDEERLAQELKTRRMLYRFVTKEMEQVWNNVMSKIVSLKEVEHTQAKSVVARKELRNWIDRSHKILRGTRIAAREDAHDAHHGDGEGDGEASSDNSNGETSRSSSENDSDEMSIDESTDDDSAPNDDDKLEPQELLKKYQVLLGNDAVARSEPSSDREDEGGTTNLQGHANLDLTASLSADDASSDDAAGNDDSDEWKNSASLSNMVGGVDLANVMVDDLPDIFNENEGSDESDDYDDDDTNDSDKDAGSGSSSNEVDGGDEDEDDDEDAGDDVGTSMAAFFNKAQLKSMATTIVDTPPTSFDEGEEEDGDGKMNNDGGASCGAHGFLSTEKIGPIQTRTTDVGGSILESQNLPRHGHKSNVSEAMDIDQPLSHPTPVRQESQTLDDSSRQLTPIMTSKPSRAESVSSVAPSEAMRAIDSLQPADSDIPRVEVPALLRGQLREYQQKGLNWLAAMYAQNSNGILADEMGLGKTIQTISLLAHLANSMGIWGPHLIIVPTSVIVNWEMEFKKFLPGFKILTYYGNIGERRQKRKGWMDNDKWHVVITSYQMALQDASSLKRRRWHYMVLDEAHNIKNFNSLRWQTLLKFNTHSRLLLTGTPLQNNLSELWSLLFFLMPEEDEQGEYKFKDLKSFQDMFKRPVDQILEHGRDAMDEEGKLNVEQLHKILRPHLLRRMKADVEKQMPKKYEHIVPCRLSKRQRQLYDGYMGLARTRESFESGNYLSIMNCFMQLRKVCNHPDLFETRQIVTSYAMPKSALADYEITELLVRKRLLNDESHNEINTKVLDLTRAKTSTRDLLSGGRLAAVRELFYLVETQIKRIQALQNSDDGQTIEAALARLDATAMQARLQQLKSQLAATVARTQKLPCYSSSLLEKLSLDLSPTKPQPKSRALWTEHYLNTSTLIHDMFVSLPQRAQQFETYIEKFACITPAVTAPDIVFKALTPQGVSLVQHIQSGFPHCPIDYDPFHTARIRLSIAFPDKSLIQYDCGKLQALARLLRQLQPGGHRALIFTQMTKVLDILEQFLSLHGYLYLRLDGATGIEQRHVRTERFNNDPRIPVFILSSRSGGVGINLTGADTVIFYDNDWNPAMDKQCQDRCHRIGQTRDVHIYRFVCEGTIEANILRKSNQKRMLDDVIIQEGDFTTEYLNRMDLDQSVDDTNSDNAAKQDGYAEADAALDKVLGSTTASNNALDKGKIDRALAEVEDQEDAEAAQVAAKDATDVDEEDFAEAVVVESHTGTSTADQGTPAQEAGTPAPVHSNDPGVLRVTEDVNMLDAEEPVTAETDTVAGAQEGDVHQEAQEEAEGEEENVPSTDDYMVRFMKWELRNWVVIEPSERSKNRRMRKSGGGRRDRGPRIRT